ncbi:LOW QUALITY PROTEIN: rab-like protein 6 [Brachyhypopomus gauderio]|uniref:LOW QUALITY PROTEIN: rab-like protein 6 n=1 Tax=Brachyhypopomus gauderio TaxID=698409 RepID=UPI00404336D3
MFSALKKLVGSEPVPQLREKNIPAGLQSMNQSLQRRFAKGVQYNMKIVIRGDRNTGKSTLWQRLQGGRFQEDYIPTQEIQVTSIHWNYKTTDDVVKVEVWDVVDKGQKIPLPEGIGKGKKRSEALKLENEPQEAENELALDAEFLDVYKNCNGVIMMFDITKQWTYNYVLRELPRVPTHMPVCVLGNHRDMGEHRVILPDDIRDFITGLNRPPGSSYIHYAESSMKNGFGLKYLHRFFNIPFLQLQRETLLRQLETNQLDIDATLEELTVQQETEDQNYEIFLEMMESRAKGYGSPSAAANGQSPSSGSQSPVAVAGGSSSGNSSPGTPQQPAGVLTHIAPSPSSSPPPPPPPLPQGQLPLPPDARSPERPAPCPPPVSAPVSAPVPAPSPASMPQKRSFISRLFGSSSVPEHPATAPEVEGVAPESSRAVPSVDDFHPDGGLDKGFLEDSVSSGTKTSMATQLQDSESDGEGRGGNPMVAGYQDDVDPDDVDQSRLETRAPVASKHLDITLSSDEGEDVAPPPMSQDTPLELVPSNNLADLSSLTIAGTPRFLEATPSLQPQVIDSRRGGASDLTLPPGGAGRGGAAQQGSRRAGAGQGESSDTEPEVAVAQQMLSFIMDDPDFESDEERVQKVTKDVFPARAELSDLSDDELLPTKSTDALMTSTRSFKVTDEGDLFGLGFEEKTVKSKESSEEPDEKETRHGTKDKKKKKKKSKEDEEKTGKKKHKHKKKEREEVSGAGEEKEKEKRKRKTRSKKPGELDDLEAFLAGGAAPVPREEGDYEEL